MRTKSMSMSSSTSPFNHALPPLPLPSPRKVLKQSTSLADLRSGLKPKWLKKLTRENDFDFGCAGEHTAELDEGDEDDEEGAPGSDEMERPTRPPRYHSAFSVKPSELESAPTVESREEGRAAARRAAEEFAAIQALNFYLAPSSSSKYDEKGLTQLAYLGEEEGPAADADSSRSRSSSTASMSSSSRPRTSDSLPSYHSYSSTSSSPISSRRPTLSAVASCPAYPLDSPPVAGVPRPYAFI